MFEDVWGWAGRLRRSVTNIGIKPAHIEHQLYELSLNLPYWRESPPLTQAARLHHQAVHIHPFENGNGRWSRALANIWLRVLGYPMTIWPATALSEESEIRAAYIATIQAADRGNEQPLIDMHTRYTPSPPPPPEPRKGRRRKPK
jgi:fido (protein-threonine AMPylation protein)